VDLSKMYEDNVSRVYGFFAYRLSHVADAEDLTAVTFERAVRHSQKYDSARASQLTWILAIAQNVLIDHFRRAGRHPEDLMAGADMESLVLTAKADASPSIGVEPGLERALSELSDRERSIVALRFGGELRAKEIGHVVGLSEANVHQILSRSLRQLRKSMPERE
jgi:RNA polymerase sigma-70 factor (ECF subfamily)